MGFWMTVFAVWVGVIFAFLSMALLYVIFALPSSRGEECYTSNNRVGEQGDNSEESDQ